MKKLIPIIILSVALSFPGCLAHCNSPLTDVKWLNNGASSHTGWMYTSSETCDQFIGYNSKGRKRYKCRSYKTWFIADEDKGFGAGSDAVHVACPKGNCYQYK
jgi:hypothetical protein